MGRLRQKQLEQAVAMRTPRAPSSDRDQVQFLWGQLAHREIQLEHVRSERGIHLSKKKLLAHMRLLSCEAKEWKSRVVSEAEQVLRESAEAACRTTRVQETMDKQFQTRWREAEGQLRDLQSPKTLRHSSLQQVCSETS